MLRLRGSLQTGVAVVCRHDVVQREVKELEKGIGHLHNCMARYNALIADNAALKVQLVNDNFHLETKIGHELQVCFPQESAVICFRKVSWHPKLPQQKERKGKTTHIPRRDSREG